MHISALIIFTDSEGPQFVDCPEDITVDCDQVPEPASPIATDDCDEDPGVTFEEEIDSGDCDGEYAITRTWTATDECGNSTSCEQIITVEDNTPSNIDSEADDLTVECDGSGNEEDLEDWLESNGGASASDECGDVTWSNNFDELSEDCGETGSVEVEFTATDGCGNSASTTAAFTIEAARPEITCPADITIECGESTSPSNTGSATCTVACGDCSVSFSDSSSGSCPRVILRVPGRPLMSVEIPARVFKPSRLRTLPILKFFVLMIFLWFPIGRGVPW